jgi:hypothetical protein
MEKCNKTMDLLNTNISKLNQCHPYWFNTLVLNNLKHAACFLIYKNLVKIHEKEIVEYSKLEYSVIKRHMIINDFTKKSRLETLIGYIVSLLLVTIPGVRILVVGYKLEESKLFDLIQDLLIYLGIHKTYILVLSNSAVIVVNVMGNIRHICIKKDDNNIPHTNDPNCVIVLNNLSKCDTDFLKPICCDVVCCMSLNNKYEDHKFYKSLLTSKRIVVYDRYIYQAFILLFADRKKQTNQSLICELPIELIRLIKKYLIL